MGTMGTQPPVRLTDPTREIPTGAPPPTSGLPQLSRGGTPDGWSGMSGDSLRIPVSKGARMVTIAILLAIDAAMVLGGVLLVLASRSGGGDGGGQVAETPAPPDATLEVQVLADGGRIVVEVPAVDAGPRKRPDPHAPPDARPKPGTRPDAAPVTVPPPGPDAAPPAAVDAAPPPAPPDADEGNGNDDIPTQINRLHSRSRSKLGGCYTRATKGLPDDQPLDGEVDIAFEVMPTGEVKDIQAVRNTTLSAELADCVVSVVAEWTLTPFTGDPVPVQKTFTFHPS